MRVEAIIRFETLMRACEDVERETITAHVTRGIGDDDNGLINDLRAAHATDELNNYTQQKRQAQTQNTDTHTEHGTEYEKKCETEKIVIYI